MSRWLCPSLYTDNGLSMYLVLTVQAARASSWPTPGVAQFCWWCEFAAMAVSSSELDVISSTKDELLNFYFVLTAIGKSLVDVRQLLASFFDWCYCHLTQIVGEHWLCSIPEDSTCLCPVFSFVACRARLNLSLGNRNSLCKMFKECCYWQWCGAHGQLSSSGQNCLAFCETPFCLVCEALLSLFLPFLFSKHPLRALCSGSDCCLTRVFTIFERCRLTCKFGRAASCSLARSTKMELCQKVHIWVTVWAAECKYSQCTNVLMVIKG